VELLQIVPWSHGEFRGVGRRQVVEEETLRLAEDELEGVLVEHLEPGRLVAAEVERA
jgi:hypothetical protein